MLLVLPGCSSPAPDEATAPIILGQVAQAFYDTCMNIYLNLALGLGVGALVVIQGAMNTRLAEATSSVISATLINFSIGALVIFAVALISGHLSSISHVVDAPKWSILGGALGAILVMGLAFLIPRIGAAHVVALVACGQALTGLVFDHLGVMGIPRLSASAPRVLGCLLVALGTLLVGRR